MWRVLPDSGKALHFCWQSQKERDSIGRVTRQEMAGLTLSLTFYSVSFSLIDKGLIRIMGRECPVSPLVYLCQSVKSNLSYNKSTIFNLRFFSANIRSALKKKESYIIKLNKKNYLCPILR
jgi:hypothetical protein